MELNNFIRSRGSELPLTPNKLNKPTPFCVDIYQLILGVNEIVQISRTRIRLQRLYF
jgi:hypothetical protein